MNTAPVAPADQVEPKKRDAAARWRKLLEDQRASGLPVSAFCRERGIAASSLFAWRRKLSGVSQETFKPVTIVAQSKPRQRGDGGDDGADRASPSAADRASPSAADRASPSAADRASPSAAEVTIELCLPRERRLMVRRGFDRQLLGEVIAALESLT